MVITICGSARFEKLFHLWNEVLTLSGHTVFGLACYPSSKRGKKQWYTTQEKQLLDEAHRRKIAASDAIFVLNHFAYLGESTLGEIEYARSLGKKIFFLESWGKGHGVDGKHTTAYQARAKKLKVFRIGSPIDTTSANGKDPWSLLPPAGAFRSKLVKLIEEITEKV